MEFSTHTQSNCAVKTEGKTVSVWGPLSAQEQKDWFSDGLFKVRLRHTHTRINKEKEVKCTTFT